MDVTCRVLAVICSWCCASSTPSGQVQSLLWGLVMWSVPKLLG